jgi:hypothetical protein
MALTTFNPRSFDLSDTYTFTGTVSGTNVGGGSLVKISEQTASASDSISFTSGIDSTYRTYLFKYISMHPSNDGVNFQFQGSTDGGSNYNTTMTTTYFDSIHREDDAGGSIQYQAANDLAQSTSYQNLARSTDNDNDSNISGELWLYNPSSTTYVKHFMNRLNHTFNSTPQHTMDTFVAGYFNTTSAINAVDFKMSSGDIDDGTITMYGIA